VLSPKIRKTDKRHKGYELFEYVCDLRSTTAVRLSDRYLAFNEIRDWCTLTWGNSCERDHYISIVDAGMSDKLNTHWCWHSDAYDMKLFFVSDKDVTWFKLRWAS
jgi:hypothetical protein